MAYSDINWVYKDPLTIQRLNQMDDNAVWTSEHRVWGLHLAFTGTATVEVEGGRVEVNGKWLIQTATASLTASTNGAWEEGTEQEGGVSATAWYVVAFNSAGSDFDVLFRASAPAYSDTFSGTATGPKIYDITGGVWYRYVGKVVNNSAGNIQSVETFGRETPISPRIGGWITFDNSGATAVVLDSFNVATLTYIAVGHFRITWDKDFANVNYAVFGGGERDSQLMTDATGGNPASGTVMVQTMTNDGIDTDSGRVFTVALGDIR